MSLGTLPTLCLFIATAAYLGMTQSATAQRESLRATYGKGGFELSESARAKSINPTNDEKFIVVRGMRETLAPGSNDEAEYRMSLGHRGIWPSESDVWNREADGADETEATVYYTLRYDDLRLGLAIHPGSQHGDAWSNDGVVFGANIDREFEAFGLGLSARYASADAPTALTIPDLGAWAVGARINFGGLHFSGEIRKGTEDAEEVGPAAASGWDEEWNLGARYRWGHNDISLAYAYGESRPRPTQAGDDKLDAAALSYARQLIGGVEWSINLRWADRDGPAATGISRGPAGPDGASLSTAIRLSF